MVDETSKKTQSEADIYHERLLKVEEYIKRSLFGQVSEFTRPFTEQHKRDVRYRIPEDESIYDRADNLQIESRRSYLFLRMLTAGLLAMYFLVAIAVQRWLPPHFEFGKQALWTAEFRAYVAVAIIVAMAPLFFGARLYARWYVIEHKIQELVAKLAHVISGKFNDIKSETTHACNRIDSRTDNGTGGWPQRARGWTRIALWSTIRGDALDRYATTVFWKIQVSVTNVERVTRLLKGFILVVAIAGLFWLNGSAGDGVWVVCLVFAGVAGWAVMWGLVLSSDSPRKQRYGSVNFWMLLVVYAALAGVWLWKSGMKTERLEAILVGAIFLIVFWFGWIVFGEFNDDRWTDSFTDELKEDRQSVPNTSFYFNTLSDRIQNLVEEIVDKERSSRGGPPAPGS